MWLTENLGNILIISIAVVSALLIILIIIEKKLYQKIIKSRYSRNNFYINEIKNITKTNSKNTLENIDRIARDFFKEAFWIKYTTDYSKLKNFFNQKNNAESAEFCSLMNEALYSGKKTDQKINQKLILLLIKIIQGNRILTKKEKEGLKELKKPII